MGKLRNKAGRGLAAERSESDGGPQEPALGMGGQTSASPRPCDGVDGPPPLNSHTHPPRGAARFPGFQGQGQKTGLQSAPAAICSQRALGACVPPVQHGGGTAAPPPGPPSGRRLFPRGPPVGGKTARTRRIPSSPLPLLADGATYPT